MHHCGSNVHDRDGDAMRGARRRMGPQAAVSLRFRNSANPRRALYADQELVLPSRHSIVGRRRQRHFWCDLPSRAGRSHARARPIQCGAGCADGADRCRRHAQQRDRGLDRAVFQLLNRILVLAGVALVGTLLFAFFMPETAPALLGPSAAGTSDTSGATTTAAKTSRMAPKTKRRTQTAAK